MKFWKEKKITQKRLFSRHMLSQQIILLSSDNSDDVSLSDASTNWFFWIQSSIGLSLFFETGIFVSASW